MWAASTTLSHFQPEQLLLACPFGISHVVYHFYILTRREIPRLAKIPRPTKFYVLKPHLEPQRHWGLMNNIRDKGHHKAGTVLDNCVQLAGDISQEDFERKDFRGKTKGTSGRHRQQRVSIIGQGSSGWFDSPPVSWTDKHIQNHKVWKINLADIICEQSLIHDLLLFLLFLLLVSFRQSVPPEFLR